MQAISKPFDDDHDHWQAWVEAFRAERASKQMVLGFAETRCAIFVCMGQRQQHRGKHPDDDRLFSAKWLPVLREAVADLSYLLSRGYADKASLKVVGDHYQLATRQRRAVSGAACSDASLARRAAHHVAVEELTGESVAVDGYNLLIIAESTLSGGVLLRGRDGCIRDLASVHGSYHRVLETTEAIRVLGEAFGQLKPERVTWHFDAPVSNSGRLAALMREAAEANGWPWTVRLDHGVDRRLAASESVVVTSDSWILDRVARWTNVKGFLVDWVGAKESLVDLG